MITRKPILGVSAALLACSLAAGTSAASAQTSNHGHGFGADLKGTIQTLGSGSFQLKTSTGSLVTVAFNAQTHVGKIVAGTTADLTAKARVRVTLQPGTTTVTAVMIEPAFTKPASGTRTTKTYPVHTHPTTGTKRGTGTTTTKKPTTGVAHSFAGGQVASLSGNTLTLTGRGGTSVKYTLASTVKITKVLAGTIGDLATGETVQVRVPATGAAREITILAS